MTTRHRSLLASLLGVLVLLTAACSGGSDEPTTAEYEQAVVEAVDRTDFALNRATNPPSPQELINRLGEASVTIDDAAADLDELGAPSEFQQDNEKLVQALGDLGNDVGLLGEQLEDPVFFNSFIQQGTQGFSFESWDKVNLALGGLLGAGLQVKTLQRQAAQG
jgi:hypothetical protein